MMNPARKEIYHTIRRLILRHKTFFIAGHRRPDGDSVAAQLVIASLLKKYNKKYDIYSADPTPKNLQFLPGVSRIRRKNRVQKIYDVAFIIECSGQDRMGNIIDLKTQAAQVVNIDHHAHCSQFGSINLVNPHASSSCEQVHGLIEAMKLKITYEQALCLFTGISTDTGYFRHANTSGYALKLASEYVSAGVHPEYVYRMIYQQKSPKELLFLGKSLCNLKLSRNKKIAVFTIPAGTVDTEGIINYGMMISTVVAAVLFQPVDTNHTRVSLRSRDNIDVGRVALQFGGGGHKYAAGCTVRSDLNRARVHVLKKLNKLM